MNSVICFLMVVVSPGLSVQLHCNNTKKIIKRATYGCHKSEFQCTSGGCISRYDVCDGPKHCTDGSDETVAACRTVGISTCASSSFQCGYGACIGQHLRCNGHSDCSDGSDEVGCRVTTISQQQQPALYQASASVCNLVGDSRKYSQCDNGQCVADYNLCDGKSDCSDRSDETEAVCYRLFRGQCSEKLWRCRYGACLRLSKRCDGQTDCWDGSDEADCRPFLNSSTVASPPPTPAAAQRCAAGQWQCRNGACLRVTQRCDGWRDCWDGSDEAGCVRPESAATPTYPIRPPSVSRGKACVVPVPTDNRVFTKFNCQTAGCSLPAGAVLADQEFVVVTCAPGHNLGHQDTQIIISCNNSHWYPALPQCFKLCPQLKADTVDILCWQGPDVGCDKPMLPNTTIEFQCKQQYKPADTNQPNVIRCEHTGQWSGQLPKCTPKCGQSNLESRVLPTIVGGIASKAGNFPWHAGIFRYIMGQWKGVCGGTLITSRRVLTAAHCVTQETQVEPQNIDTRLIMVALGKYYRDWAAEESTEVKANVKEIYTHPLYRGESQNLEKDIAMLVLESDVPISSFVMPACVDYSQQYVKHLTQLTGYIAGWGYTENCKRGDVCEKLLSPELLYSNTSIMTYVECYRKMQTIHKTQSKLATDKYCAGNGSVSLIQKGDSGGGLMFVIGEAFYVYGVVSGKLEVESKPPYSFSTFTSVPLYVDWLKSIKSEIGNQ